MPRNDPDWNNNNGGPPDLEELWQRFQQKVNGLFGRKARGAGPREGRGRAVGLIVVILAVLWLASGLYVVHEGERGLVLRLGHLQEVALPGTHWRLPYPVDRVRIVNLQQVRVVRIGFLDNTRGSASADALMLTADQNLLNVQAAVQYTVKDAIAWSFNQRHPAEAVHAVADSVIRDAVAKSTMTAMLGANRAVIAGQAARQLQAALDQAHIGVTVGRVAFMNVQPPQPVQAAFSDIGKASQEADKQKGEAQAYAGEVIPKAQAEAARLLNDANTYKSQVVARAQAEAAQFNQAYAGYHAAPQVTRENMYLSTMQQIITQANTVVVDAKGGAVNLALDKLPAAAKATPEVSAAAPQAQAPATAEKSLAAPPAATEKSPAAPPAAPAPSAGRRERSIEGLRSREREERP